MKKYKFYFMIWLLPAYLLFLVTHQGAVLYSLADTYENGSSYTAEVLDFEIKQIAAQTSGYIVLRFETTSGEVVQQRLTLPAETASKLSNIRVVPVRYQANSYQSIVMMPTYSTHKSLILTNMAVAFLGFLIAMFIAWSVHRYAVKKLNSPEEKFIIERVD